MIFLINVMLGCTNIYLKHQQFLHVLLKVYVSKLTVSTDRV